jgi:hypothetical protein
MSLQKHFSAKRFYKCLNYDLVLNGKTYLFTLIGLMMVLLIINLINLNSFSSFYRLNYGFNTINFDNYFYNSYYLPVFVFFIIVGSILSAGTSFSALRTSQKSINYLLFPASSLEKFLVQFLIRIPVFVMLFIPIYWLNFKFSYNFYSLFDTVSEAVKSYGLLSPFQPKNMDDTALCLIVITAVMSSLFAFVGAAYFKKYALFKSVFTFGLTAFFMFLLMVLFSHLFYEHHANEFFQVKLKMFPVYENFNSIEIYTITLFTGLSIFLLPLAYFKLKEREV